MLSKLICLQNNFNIWFLKCSNNKNKLFKQYKSGEKWKADISFLLHIPKATIINVTWVSLCVLSRFTHAWLFETLWAGAHWTPVHGIFQARILEWAAKPSSRGSSHVSDDSCIAGGFFTPWVTWEALSVLRYTYTIKTGKTRDLPCGPVAKTSCSQCRGPRFHPWSEN